MYIGAVAVLPTYAPLVAVLIERSTSLVLLVRLLEESKSGKQALREVRMKHLRCRDFPFVTSTIAVWGDGVRGGLHVLCSVSDTPFGSSPYIRFD